MLLDSEGHIKVTDFGLAKGNMSDEERTNSFIGTMEYMAPEIIAGRGHGKAVDWWSVGILLYEMLCGVPPYRAKSRTQLQKQILGAKLKMPRKCPRTLHASAVWSTWNRRTLCKYSACLCSILEHRGAEPAESAAGARAVETAGLRTLRL